MFPFWEFGELAPSSDGFMLPTGGSSDAPYGSFDGCHENEQQRGPNEKRTGPETGQGFENERAPCTV